MGPIYFARKFSRRTHGDGVPPLVLTFSLSLFRAQYCFLLADVEEVELAAEVLLHVREAGVFRQVEARQNALRWGLIGVSLSYSLRGLAKQTR